MNAPSDRPGLRCGSSTRQASAIVRAGPTSASTSMPIIAAGTRPKRESAEKRPPISGGLMNTSRNRPSMARRCSAVSGSVIAIMREPGSATPASLMRRRASAANTFGSMVEPDLLAITKSDDSGRAMAARTASGSTESNTVNRGKPEATPMTARSTSGARLEPPMPSKTMSVMPLLRNDAEYVRSRGSCGSIVAIASSHPNRLATFSCTEGSALQRSRRRVHSASATLRSCKLA